MAVCIEASKCMKLTNSVSLSLAKAACTSPDLTKFQKEIDQQGLRKYYLTQKITHVTLQASVKAILTNK